MKKILIPILILSTLLLTGCNSKKTFNGTEYDSYGLFNEGAVRSRKVCYQISPTSVIIAIILIETVFVPVIVLGWDLFEPVRLKTGDDDLCNAKD